MKYYKTLANGNRVLVDGDGIAECVETITANKTLDREDSGKTFYVGTDALVITLPPVSDGLEYTFINSGADGNNTVTISPDAADAIFGTIANAAADSVAGGVDDKDWENTKATANKGDRCTLVGGAGGWYIKDGVGIWASEA